MTSPAVDSSPAFGATSHADFTALFTSLGVPADLVGIAWAKLVSGEVTLLALSGKMGSGKDTIAPAVLVALGYGPLGQVQISRALRSELDQVIAIVTEAPNPEVAVGEVSSRMTVDAEAAGCVVGTLFELCHRPSGPPSAWDRLPEIRRALQQWGTEVRRAGDDDYWLRRVLAGVPATLAAGCAVYWTDVRSPNEVQWARRSGFFVARLDVDLDVCRDRIRRRDGIEIDPDALNHPTETALDGYAGFDLVVPNNGAPEPTVAVIAAAMTDRHRPGEPG